ncbi:MAG: flippase-like domain-containing protein [Planctomycetes bacterium]|nr:flippase-like domain-containing protein [Planctomycetota bacterium]
MKRGILYTVLLLLAIGVIVVIFSLVGWQKVLSNIQNIGFRGFFAYLAISILVLFMTVVGWWVILRSHEIKVGLGHTAIAQFIGYAVSMITPSMYIGGEPLKAYYIGQVGKTTKTRAFATAVFAKFQELSCLLFFIYAGTLIMIIEAQAIHLSRSLWILLLATDIILGLFMLVALRSVVKNTPLFSHIIVWFGKRGILKKRIETALPKILHIEEMINQAFKHNWKAGALAFLFNFLSVAFAISKIVVFFYFLYGYNKFSLTEIAVMFTLSQLVMVLPLTPGSIGMYEGGQIGILHGLIGIEFADAVTYLVIVRFVDLILVGSGIYLALHYSLVRFVHAHFETQVPDETTDPDGHRGG